MVRYVSDPKSPSGFRQVKPSETSRKPLVTYREGGEGTYTSPEGKPITKEQAQAAGVVDKSLVVKPTPPQYIEKTFYLGKIGDTSAKPVEIGQGTRSYWLGTAGGGYREAPQQVSSAPFAISRFTEQQQEKEAAAQQQGLVSSVRATPGQLTKAEIDLRNPIYLAMEKARAKEYKFTTGTPAITRTYQYRGEAPRISEYSIFGFPVGRKIPVEEGKQYVRPALFGRLQKLDIKGREVSSETATHAEILGTGVAMFSPIGFGGRFKAPSIKTSRLQIKRFGEGIGKEGVRLKEFARSEEGSLFPKMTFGKKMPLGTRFTAIESPKSKYPSRILESPPKTKDFLAGIREEYAQKKTPYIEVRPKQPTESKGFTVIDRRRIPTTPAPEYKPRVETGFTVTKRGRPIELPKNPPEPRGISIEKEIRTRTGQILIQKQMLKPPGLKKSQLSGLSKEKVVSRTEKPSFRIPIMTKLKYKTMPGLLSISKQKPSLSIGTRTSTRTAFKMGTPLKMKTELSSALKMGTGMSSRMRISTPLRTPLRTETRLRAPTELIPRTKTTQIRSSLPPIIKPPSTKQLTGIRKGKRLYMGTRKFTELSPIKSMKSIQKDIEKRFKRMRR